MWYPAGNFTLRQAKDFLRKDFLKVVRRTKYLYVDKRPTKKYGASFFEPILLCLSWCDFLGALYSGSGLPRNKGGLSDEKRMTAFIVDILGEVNTRYKGVSRDLVRVYRHGPAHAYAPAGNFHIAIRDPIQHLQKRDNRLIISLDDLLREMIAATKYFAIALKADSKSLKRGTLGKPRQNIVYLCGE
jgi:hypothetical protein